MKRLFDIVFALLGIAVLALPMLVIAICVAIDLGFPILFRQQRPGLNGKPFEILKFRTMTDLVDDSADLLSDGQRLTRLGILLRRWSLDELPELVNILRGDMSFVGPRPLLMEYLDLYSEEQSRRHNMRPGLTGWAQVNGRNSISWPEKLDLDVWYVDNHSLLLDLKIFLLTFLRVIRRDGISQEGHATSEPFRGEQG